MWMSHDLELGSHLLNVYHLPIFDCLVKLVCMPPVSGASSRHRVPGRLGKLHKTIQELTIQELCQKSSGLQRVDGRHRCLPLWLAC